MSKPTKLVLLIAGSLLAFAIGVWISAGILTAIIYLSSGGHTLGGLQ